MWKLLLLAVVALALSGCQANRKFVPGVVPDQLSPISLADAPQLGDPFPEYVIGPQDVLSIRVFREPELSLERVTVDSGGRLEMPLIGKVIAANKTPDALSEEITGRFGNRYLVDPNVSVNIETVNSKRLTVEGEVENPGIYPLADQSNLLSAVAMAGGPTDVAQLKEVAVFRKVKGQKMVAVFDLSRVRSGEMTNPEILPGDIVVVGFSSLRRNFQDFLTITPLLSIFRPFN